MRSMLTSGALATGGSPAWDRDWAAEIIAAHGPATDGALPILHALQDAFGCVPRESEPMIADALNLSLAEVRGVVSFYHDFRGAPPGRHVLKICRAEACQSVGAAALAESLLSQLGIKWGETTVDGALTIEPVYCLGLCACGPSGLLDGEPLGRLDERSLSALAATAREVVPA
jgi:formate dehydrogenase subunit gamma